MDLGELWIDRPNASDVIKSLSVSREAAEHLNFFWENGYTIFKNVVPDNITDAIIDAMHAFPAHPEKYAIRQVGKYIDPGKLKALSRERIIDIYGLSKVARQAVYQPVVAEFLSVLFGEPAVAMQSLCFEYGSEQSIHQDTAYVVSSKPLSLAAAWIALEDVAPGSGELIYYPGSHRFKHFLFGGDSKCWSKNTHGDAIHRQFVEQLHGQAREKGIKQASFLAKKGDVLIWHADLAHGGAPITDPNKTRRSYVVHFCPQSVKPNYAKKIPKEYFELKDPSGHYFASRHYDLRSLNASGEGKVFYDGGVTARRQKAKGAAVPA